jgi:hypothetical protein
VASIAAGRRADLAALAAVGAVLLVVVLYPTMDRDLRFGMGPDVPVYIWWGRAAAELGVDAVPDRPGIVALFPALGGTLGTGAVATQAGLQYALVLVVGLASAGLAAAGGARRLAWLLSGILAGLFATFLAAGYVSNLTMAALFLAALVALASGRRRGLTASIGLLAAAGLAHPQFLLVGTVVIVLSAVFARLQGLHEESGRALLVVVGGWVLAAAGLLIARVGGPAIVADTSKDALLRRVGLEADLRSLFVDRFARSWDRYAPWALLPLAALGVGALPHEPAGGKVRRLLAAWLAVTLLGVPLAIISGRFPPDRVVTFSFCLPILAALGFSRLIAVRLVRPLPVVIAIVALAAIAWPVVEAWNEKRVFVKRPQLEQLVAAGRVAATTGLGTPLVFVVNDMDEPPLFHLTFTGNVVRSGVPASRIQDVRVLPGPLRDTPAGTAVFVLPTIAPDERAPSLHRWPDGFLSSVPDPRVLPVVPDEVEASTPDGIASATLGILALVTVLGYGWSRFTLEGTIVIWAAAPAFGLGAILLAAFIVDRVGVGLDGRLGPMLASVLAGVGGYAVAHGQHRRARRDVGER